MKSKNNEIRLGKKRGLIALLLLGVLSIQGGEAIKLSQQTYSNSKYCSDETDQLVEEMIMGKGKVEAPKQPALAKTDDEFLQEALSAKVSI